MQNQYIDICQSFDTFDWVLRFDHYGKIDDRFLVVINLTLIRIDGILFYYSDGDRINARTLSVQGFSSNRREIFHTFAHRMRLFARARYCSLARSTSNSSLVTSHRLR